MQDMRIVWQFFSMFEENFYLALTHLFNFFFMSVPTVYVTQSEQCYIFDLSQW